MGIVGEGEPLLYKGVNLAAFPGESLGEIVRLPHPSHLRELNSMSVYSVLANGESIVYAGTELSVCVYGFYVAV